MKYRIDPTIDCVFKAILGSEENKNLLVHFLNAVLELTGDAKIVSVELVNPYLEREFQTDKMSIVDVKAKDTLGTTYQVDIQLSTYPSLKKRMLFNWSKIYTNQMSKGQQYSELKPVVSIWILVDNLLTNSPEFYHKFRIYDPSNKVLFSEIFSLCILELNKAQFKKVETEKERWTMLFKDGKSLDEVNLPNFMKTPEMRQAMNTMIRFSEKEREHDLYLRRQDYILEQQEIRKEQQRVRMEQQRIRLERQTIRENYELLKQQKERVEQRMLQAEQQKEQIARKKEQAEQQKEQAEQQKEQAEQQKEQAEQQKEQAEQQKEQAEQQKEQAEQQILQVTQEKEQAEQQILQVTQEKEQVARQKEQAEQRVLQAEQQKEQTEQKAKRYLEALKKAGINLESL